MWVVDRRDAGRTSERPVELSGWRSASTRVPWAVFVERDTGGLFAHSPGVSSKGSVHRSGSGSVLARVPPFVPMSLLGPTPPVRLPDAPAEA